MKRLGSLVCLATWLVLSGPPPVQGAFVELSQFVSDGATPPDVDLLDGRFDFTLDSATLPATLTFSVTNLTADPNAFNITEMYFNVSENVTGMTLSAPPQWSLGFAEDGFGVNGFGRFDVQIIDALKGPVKKIGSGETLAFSIELLGSGPVFDTDFVTELSAILPGDLAMIAAAKFVNGPGDASAYGASVPEPASLTLLLLGASFVTRRRR